MFRGGFFNKYNAQGTSDPDPEPREVSVKPNFAHLSPGMRKLLSLAIEAQIAELELVEMLYSLRIFKKTIEEVKTVIVKRQK